MGIIKKQALYSTIINFVGITFGSIFRFIMPFVLSRSQIGVLSMIDSITGIFVIIFSLGYNLIIKKVFPSYRDPDKGHYGFLSLGLILSAIGITIGTGIFYLFDDWIISNNSENGDLLKPFLYLIPILVFFKIVYFNIDGYVRMLFKTVLGTFLEGFLTKLGTFTLILLFYFLSFEYDYFVVAYCLILSFPGLIITIYALFVTKKIVLPSREIFKAENKIGAYMLFGILAGSSSAIIQYVDTLMIYKMVPVDATTFVGIYSIMLFASILITIPQRNMGRISAVIVAESWKENNLKNIQDVYEKSALNLLIIGGFIFIIGWACMDPVLAFLPKYEMGKYVFFFLGLARVIELGTGVNNEIIETSSKYKYITYLNITLAVLVIVFNYFLIQSHGIVGAAVATFLAMVIVNFLRALLLKRAFNLIPFNKNFFIAAFILTAFILFISFVDYSADPIWKIAINVSVLTISFWTIIVLSKVSEDINGSVYRMRKRFFGK